MHNVICPWKMIWQWLQTIEHVHGNILRQPLFGRALGEVDIKSVDTYELKKEDGELDREAKYCCPHFNFVQMTWCRMN
jgi:hypothetical protein